MRGDECFVHCTQQVKRHTAAARPWRHAQIDDFAHRNLLRSIHRAAPQRRDGASQPLALGHDERLRLATQSRQRFEIGSPVEDE